MNNKPTNHLQATGYNQVMQEINPRDSKSVHLGIVSDHESQLKQRAANGHPKDIIEGIRKACAAVRGAYGQKVTQL